MKLSWPSRILALSAAAAMALTFASIKHSDGANDTWRDAIIRNIIANTKTVADSTTKGHPDSYIKNQIVEDWLAQDGMLDSGLSKEGITHPLVELGEKSPLWKTFNELNRNSAPMSDERWASLYMDACEARRTKRLQPHMATIGTLVFTKHFDMGGSHYAYTEAQSDAQAETSFSAGASLCLLKMDGIYGDITTLLEDRNGVIRDPDVSFDAKRVLFSWKKSYKEDDYHLYEMNLADKEIKQITEGKGFADYEGVYLPSGDILFNSSRCVQTVDCWWTEVSNLYTCNASGKYLRRLSFDQVHTNYPTVTPDGRIIYTRWDYNDRGQIFPQGLFQMYPDGTGQAAFYGNNSWFPTSILHARMIPGTQKVVGIFSGHHSHQNGWLGIIDPSKGREENSGAQLICPTRETKAERIDAYGQQGDQFQYPYPLNESEFIVTYRREGTDRFVIAYVTADGKREILACDRNKSCNQPIPLVARPVPHTRPSSVDYRKKDGTFYMQDVYVGDGLKGIERGTVKSLRIIALDFRAAGIGSNGNGGPAGAAMASTPISISGTWDVKKVLGEAKVYDDGSAFFKVPARTPIYFQAIDAKGHAVQTMRSWATLQPGEAQSCVGCHEDKNSVAVNYPVSKAMKAGPQKLMPWDPQVRGFSFIKEIQPILDKHCISCHNGEKVRPFSLTSHGEFDESAQRSWSDAYKNLLRSGTVNHINIQSVPSMLPPYSAGAAKSRLITMLENGHKGTKLTKYEMDRIACWMDLLVPFLGDYAEGMEGDNLKRYTHFLDKRKAWEAQETKNIEELIRSKR